MAVISILIPTIPRRQEMFTKLLGHMLSQSRTLDRLYDVQFVYNADIDLSVGAKRNWLISRASGEYIIFVDDDDWVPDYYVEELLKASESGADAFAINGIMTTNGQHEIKWWISKDLPYEARRDKEGKTIYVRWNNHISGLKKSIAEQFKFVDASWGEDFDWCKRIHEAGVIKTEYVIERPMYHYRFLPIKP